MSLSDFESVCVDSIQCATAFLIYQDLLEDKRLTNVDKFYDEDIKQLFLSGKRERKEILFWPQLNTQELDLQLLKVIQTKYIEKSIFLGICDTSSNVLYFEVTGDLIEKF